MTDATTTDDESSIVSKSLDDADRPTPEPSPSAGWRETAALMHVTAGLEECDVLGCDREAEPIRVVDTDTVREDRAKDFLVVSS